MSTATDYIKHWDDKFRTRSWGKWPPEDLVRFMGRNFKDSKKDTIRVLEVGCGPGANIWFLHREGFAVSGIDGSPAAIDLARERLTAENRDCKSPEADLRVGNFQKLPWGDGEFDVVLDIFAVYANTLPVINSAVAEIARVLKPGGLFYCKLWGIGTTGFGEGTQLETGTFDNIPSGPCKDMGVSHFFSQDEIKKLYGRYFMPLAIDMVLRTDMATNQKIEEFHCQFRKAS